MRCMNCMQTLSNEETTCPYCGYICDNVSTGDQFLQPGLQIGHYELGRVLGSGGFGVTYLAWDNYLGRRVAIKEYFPSNLSTRAPGQSMITVFTGEKQQIFIHGLQRFIEEAQLLLRFGGYDGIVSVYDVFEANGTAYMVMEYIEGVTLKQYLSQFKRIEERQLLDCMIPMLLTLKFVHQLGYVHRDISPDNIMCLPDGTVKLVDFGAARYALMEESQSLSVIIKQGFTPVEQYQSHGNQGPWTDIYAVGATMYQALTGTIPFESLERLTDDILKLPSQLGVEVSPATELAIMSALNVHPEDRPQSLDAFLAILTGTDPGHVVQRKKKRISMVAVAVVVLVSIVGIGGIIGAIWHVYNKVVIPPSGDLNVPNIIGRQVDEAAELLESQKLHLKVTGGKYYDAEMIERGFVEAGQIMTQDPAEGTVEIYSTIGAEISKGKKQVYMPLVTNMMLESAEEQLKSFGFDDSLNIEVVEEYSDEYMVGSVISQSVPSGEGTDYDATITISVSKGNMQPNQDHVEALLTVGDYIGENFEEVKTELLGKGVYLIKSAAIYSTDTSFDGIISQYPAPGTEINPGEAVYVVASLGIEQARVPDVRYLSLEDAKRQLALSGLSCLVTYVADPLIAIDHVVSQKIAPGEQVPFGTAVELVISQTEPFPSAVYSDKNSVCFGYEALVLRVGDYEKLEWEYGGKESIIWSSSNPTIAVVDDQGGVRANHFGSTTITASTGENIAICTVLVEDDLVVPSRFVYLMETGEMISAAEVLPEECRVRAIWRSCDAGIALVDADGVITALMPGHTCVTASCGEVVFGFCVTVESSAKYIALPKIKFMQNRKTAEQTLNEQNLEYTVQLEYNDKANEGDVLRISYTGYMDEENYYIEENTPVTVYVSSRKSSAEKYIELPRTDLTKNRRAAEQALNNQQVEYTVQLEYSDKANEGDVLRIEYTGYMDEKNYYIRENTPVTVYVSAGQNTVESIIISTPPKKMTYMAGEVPDYSGMVITVTYRDGTIQVVTSGYAAPSEPLTIAPYQTVSVYYEGKSTTLTFHVVVEAELKIKANPSKLEYYIGDSLNTTGLVLSYTDENGKTQDISSGFTTQVDLWEAGTRQVIVVYQGLNVSYNVTVKTPMVQLTKSYQEEEIVIYAHTDPANQPVEWYSSNEEILYFENGKVVPVSSGTATITVIMTYHGIEYSDDILLTVEAVKEEKTYFFDIWREEIIDVDGMPLRAEYGVDSDIPDFNPKDIIWSISTGSRSGWVTDSYSYMVDEFGMTDGESYTITATYVYNGKEYSATYTLFYHETFDHTDNFA